jgi:hypothetical protein
VRKEAEAVSKSDPGSVRHLFVSPKQDFAVTVGTNGLIVFAIENSHITSVLKTQSFDAACIPVMEQWSMGRFVSAWDAAVQKETPAILPAAATP